MHYDVKMVRRSDGLVRYTHTQFFPDAETALKDGSEIISQSFDSTPDPSEWAFQVSENPEAEAEENELSDRMVKNRIEFYKARGHWPD